MFYLILIHRCNSWLVWTLSAPVKALFVYIVLLVTGSVVKGMEEMVQLTHFPRVIGMYSSIRAIQSRSKSVEKVGGCGNWHCSCLCSVLYRNRKCHSPVLNNTNWLLRISPVKKNTVYLLVKVIESWAYLNFQGVFV